MLNILNGKAMYDDFFAKGLLKKGVYIPFNEAMCIGGAIGDIFSEEFFRQRSQMLGVEYEDYYKITVISLAPLLNGDSNEIVLWFDGDMFCQINLLTILAYLDMKGYSGKVIFNLVGGKFEIVSAIQIDFKGYYEIYKRVLIDKTMPEKIDLPIMERGIALYLSLQKEDNEIARYIKVHSNENEIELVKGLSGKFCEYGLGDTQNQDLVNKVKGVDG